MNIANIFGMYIGADIYCEDETGCVSWGELVTIRKGVKGYSLKVKYTELNNGRWYKLNECKLILKPLSAMTEEDKREFEKEFADSCDGYKIIKIEIEGHNVVAYGETTIFVGQSEEIRKIKRGNCYPDEMCWLASQGYDIGIVPDEYKILENGGEK